MCGNTAWDFIIGGLILAAAMLMRAHPQNATRAAPVQHTITGLSTHVAIEMRPITLDIDLANARVVVDVSL